MRKFVYFLVIGSLLLMGAVPVLAQGPVVQHADPVWQAVYWNNTTLTGEPVLERSEAVLSHDWGSGSPHPSVVPDGFSARWTRYIDVASGIYRFTATSDDGIRVWIDDELMINEWYDHPAKTVSVERRLEAGHHWVEVEFYENGGMARAELTWVPVSTSLRSWHASYWNNTTLSGEPVLQRSESALDHNWGVGSPDVTVAADNFSARWTRYVDLPAGLYRFTATSDDGIRVWVDNELIIDMWGIHPARTTSAEKQLNAGEHWIVVEYYEATGLAVAKLSWDVVSATIMDWQAEYYNNMTLSGIPALVRTDALIDFDWGGGSPAPNLVDADQFSVRWTRTLDLPAGDYRFIMTVDDGGRLWVNDHLLIEGWREQAAHTYTGDIHLPGGPVPVRMEYFENGGRATASLSWMLIDPLGLPVVVIEDDTHPGFVRGGAASGWDTAPEGYGGRLTWTWNHDWERPQYNWARWYPNLLAGEYEVMAYIPDRFTTTSSARYQVKHAAGTTARVIDQSANGGRWVSLGTYWFDGTSDEHVLLSDVTQEPLRSRLIAFDAIKWVPR